jgi:hypothetical protein
MPRPRREPSTRSVQWGAIWLDRYQRSIKRTAYIFTVERSRTGTTGGITCRVVETSPHHIGARFPDHISEPLFFRLAYSSILKMEAKDIDETTSSHIILNDSPGNLSHLTLTNNDNFRLLGYNAAYSVEKRRFERICRLHLHGGKISKKNTSACHLFSNSFLAGNILRRWKRRQNIPPKREFASNRLNGVISQKIGTHYSPCYETLKLSNIVLEQWAEEGTDSRGQVTGGAGEKVFFVNPLLFASCTDTVKLLEAWRGVLSSTPPYK